MSIAEESKNINSGTGKRLLSRFQVCIVLISGVFSILGFLGLGILWNRVNEPAPIVFQCSDEVLEGLKNTEKPPIVEPKTSKKSPPSKVSKPIKK